MGVKIVSVKKFAKKVMNHESLFIVDARNQNDFEDWKIEGKNAEVINLPYSEVKENIGQYVHKLPKDRRIYTVCAKGKSSKMMAELLEQAGCEDVYSIEGGMRAWSEHLEPVKIGDLNSGGAIYQIIRLGKGCLSYLISSNGVGAIIDSNRMIDTYVQLTNEYNISIKYVLDTHLHADHISGGRKLARKLGATYYLPSKDAREAEFKFVSIEDGNEIKIGNTVIQALYSPGHTIGSTSFIIDNQYLLTGDILFIDSIGRPDLAGKAADWVRDLRQTLYKRYRELADELIVLPAHFMGIDEMNNDGIISERLGVLYQENHGLNIQSDEEFSKAVTENLPPQPHSYEEIRQTNLGKIAPEEDQEKEMEIGPNRCAIR
ncbi:MBL fold metallo-hydrolase [Peribacillus frigoritolerans]|uniref:MBL fold metallo-hydrolase n=1 Tax=Peribacillus frigoritolerans TaxID=450367 RepID=UPI0021A82E99|nr:MBL fold metallo-hydrolase [Peribacillus frigoritolerans]MCT1389872.1 MBL fold metallo-hydrolase [Peribacillus frigoritolerans]